MNAEAGRDFDPMQHSLAGAVEADSHWAVEDERVQHDSILETIRCATKIIFLMKSSNLLVSAITCEDHGSLLLKISSRLDPFHSLALS